MKNNNTNFIGNVKIIKKQYKNIPLIPYNPYGYDKIVIFLF